MVMTVTLSEFVCHPLSVTFAANTSTPNTALDIGDWMKAGSRVLVLGPETCVHIVDCIPHPLAAVDALALRTYFFPIAMLISIPALAVGLA